MFQHVTTFVTKIIKRIRDDYIEVVFKKIYCEEQSPTTKK